MSSVLDSVDAQEIEDQTAFNLAVWKKLVADPELARLAFRVETDRYGQMIMTPPHHPEHGHGQSKLAATLDRLLPAGVVITECPLSTSGGVKATDVAWISRGRYRRQRGKACLTEAPEICVEVLSPGNTRREMREKRALYFEAGAEEVWFCSRDCRLDFFLKDDPETPATSRLCSTFPSQLDLDL